MGDIAFADVGVRRKGSYSYRVLPQKASLKIKLNKWVKGQKVYGLTDLTLNNMVRGPTFLSERLSFYVFRAVGLPAQLNDTLFTRCKLGATCWSAYKAEMKSVLDTFEELDLVSLAKKWNAQIDALARSDPKRETTIAGYEERTRKLYAWLAARPQIVRAQLGP